MPKRPWLNYVNMSPAQRLREELAVIGTPGAEVFSIVEGVRRLAAETDRAKKISKRP